MRKDVDKFWISPGKPSPLGAYATPTGYAFAIHILNANQVTLLLFSLEGAEKLEILLDPAQHQTGETWHVEVEGLHQPFAYGYRRDSEPYTLLDPCAKGIHAPRRWYAADHPISDAPYFYAPLGVVPSTPFDWEGISSPNISLEQLVIYELHLRGYTRHSSSQTAHPGTFLGMIEKISHLKNLGINAVELLPIFEFDEMECDRCAIEGRKRLGNYWGYSSLSFFAPMGRYAAEEKTS